jgi:hypothetical protein
MHYCNELYALHYHIIYCPKPLFVASDLYYHQHKFVATYVYYLED